MRKTKSRFCLDPDCLPGSKFWSWDSAFEAGFNTDPNCLSGFFYIEGANYWLFEVLLPICCRILLEVGRKKRPVRAGNRFYLDPGCTVHLDQATDEKKQYHGFCRIWIVRPDQRWKK